jgi:hypothetical protein
MVLFSFVGPVNSEPPRTNKDGRNEAACHRRETANTGGASAPNGAGSAVDGTPRSAMGSVDWFGLTGTWKQASLQRDGKYVAAESDVELEGFIAL